MATVHDIKLGDFSDRVGEEVRRSPSAGRKLPLMLRSRAGAARLAPPRRRLPPRIPRPARPACWTQGIFPFEIGEDRFEIFIVPIGARAQRTRYEAVYY